MPVGLTGLIIDSLLHLSSGYLILRCFLPPSIQSRGWPPLLCSFLFLFSGIAIEKILGPFLLEGSLVFLFFFCILLADKVAKLPLLNATGALFCHFCLMLGLGLLPEASLDSGSNPTEPDTPKEESLEDSLDDLLEAGLMDDEVPPTPTPVPEPLEPTRPAVTPTWVTETRELYLHRRLLAARNVLREVLYRPERSPEDIPPQPTPALQATPTPAPTPIPGSELTAEEYFALFDPTPTPAPLVHSTPLPPTPTPLQGENVVNPGDAVAVNSDQLSNMVQLRNRSTDTQYLPPEFEIDALGIGNNGRYAIVNGTLMREGNIIRVSESTVRGWRLVKILEGELYWQPLF